MYKYLSIGALLTTSLLFGAEAIPADFIPLPVGGTENSSAEIDFTKELKRISMTLGAIIILTGATVFVLRRFSRTRRIRYNAESKIHILEQRNLSPKTTAYLLEIDGKKIFCAESPHGITSMLCPEAKAKSFQESLSR